MFFPFQEKLAEIESCLPVKFENLSILQQFAVAMLAFSDADWQNFVNQVTQTQRNIEQRVVVQTHTNNPSGSHSHTDHRNTDSHTDKVNTTNSHDNTYKHGNHTGHDNSYAHTNNGYKDTHYNESGSHLNGAGSHWDKYTEHSNHSNTTTHSNRDHSHDTYHLNTGINHTNYIPSVPSIYTPDVGVVALNTVRVGVFSYDKNNDGAGTQDDYSKKVYYTVQIRKVRNIDGSSSVSSWVVLANRVLMNNYGGYVFDINTLDPLKTGNTNPNNAAGYYELKVTAANILSNGTVHESYEATAELMITNNFSPTISVTNGSEFINFTFSYYGGVYNSFKSYDEGLYAGADESQKHGILVRINTKDEDRAGYTIQNWQKGVVRLKDTNGNTIAQANIVWQNNDTIISSNNNNVQGAAFIPKEAYQSIGAKDCKIEVEVRDYMDSGCQNPAGPAVIIDRTVPGGTLMNMYIDTSSPTINILDTNYNWRNANVNTTIQISDQGNYTQKTDNFSEALYAITSQPIPPASGWIAIPAGTKTTRSQNVSISNEGIYYVHVQVKDHANNTKTATYGPYKIDKTLPDATSNVSRSNGQFVITVNATDNLSGVKSIKLPNGQTVAGSTATYTVSNPGLYTFEVEDNAGNKRTLSVNVENKAYVEAVQVTNIVNPPQAYSFPIDLPVGVPINIKTGYNISMTILVDNCDQVKLRAKVNGSIVPMQYNGSKVNEITINTGTLGPKWVNATFYFKDNSIAQNQIISIDIEGVRVGGINTLSDFGSNIFRVVGSLSGDSNINLIK
jgi:hypothetical protein